MDCPPLPVISLFSGALGLDLGLEQAGFEIRVAVECNKLAVDTIRRNRPALPVIAKKIEDVTTAEILEHAGLQPGEPAIVTGGPSCQSFSTVGRRGSLGDPRGGMFREFLRVVREARPRFFVMENVRGVLSAAIKHRPLRERGPGYPPLSPDEELGSALIHIIAELKATDYYTVFDLLNTANYGVAQTRERVIFIGSRDGEPVHLPAPTHSEFGGEGLVPWLTLREALRSLDDPAPVYIDFPPSKAKYLAMVPEGGNWRQLPLDLRAEALGAAYVSWGGRAGFSRRLAWDRPAPALTTNPTGKATSLCHPTTLRPLSVKEYAKLQQFPDEWEFAGGARQQYIQIGNAVPVGLGRLVGLTLLDVMRNPRPGERPLGAVACANQELLKRLAGGARTRLNPNRMREIKGADAARQWMNGSRSRRRDILEYVLRDGDEAAN